MKKFFACIEDFLEIGGTTKDVIFLLLSSVGLLFSIFEFFPFSPVDPAWIAIILCGSPIVIKAVIGLVTKFDIKADVLVSIALIAALIATEWFAAGQVAFIMQLGGLLEDLTAEKAKEGINKLIDMKPKMVHAIINGKETLVDASSVMVDTKIRVNPGERVPIDGRLVSATGVFDESIITGESTVVYRNELDNVVSGSMVMEQPVYIITTKTDSESTVQKIIEYVSSEDSEESHIVKLADKWATYVVIVALVCAVITYFVTGKYIRAITALIVFCPCSLVLAAPVAVIATVGNLAKHGYLVHRTDALEQLTHVKTICFDKTGTLTRGAVLKYSAVDVVDKLNLSGYQTIMLTGDKNDVATSIAEKVGVTTYYAECLPGDKLNHVTSLQQDSKVLMVGDGLNDLQALKKADVSIAMGYAGTDIASEASDIVLTTDDIGKIPYVLGISHKMLRKIKFNIVFSMLLNFASIGLAAAGLLSPITGALVHNIGSVFVCINAAMLLLVKDVK